MAPMFSVRRCMPSASHTRRLSAMSAWVPSGSITPNTFFRPSARAQTAAATLESLPPEMPTTTRLKPCSAARARSAATRPSRAAIGSK